jgi:hypothetical protein
MSCGAAAIRSASYVSVNAAFIERFAPVVELLAGE